MPTHYSGIKQKTIVTQGGAPVATSIGNPPEQPVTGDFFWDAQANRMAIYNATMVPAQWVYSQFTTTTSTSTSTTTTSTSTTTTSTSQTTSTSTSITTSTSTTTTL